MKVSALIEKITKALKVNHNRKPLSTQEKWLLLLLSGVLLAVIIFPAGKDKSGVADGSSVLNGAGGSMFGAERDKEAQTASELYLSGNGNMTLNQYEVYLSRKLEEIITQIDGAGKVDAWVTLKSSSEKIFFEEKDNFL